MSTNPQLTIVIASDHGGLAGRQAAIQAAKATGAQVIDLGPQSADSCDYPDYAHQVAEQVARGDAQFGILVCGTGQGMAMAANRHPGIRAAVLTDAFTTEMSRAHNDANIACFGERVISTETIAELVTLFLKTPFAGDRHVQRVKKIEPA